MKNSLASSRSPAANLYRLFWLRNFVWAGQTAAIVIAELGLGIALPLWPLLSIVSVMAFLNLLTWFRWRSEALVNDWEVFAQILVDVAGLTGLLFLSGGSTNPFTAFYLLPLTIAAVMLPRRFAWIVAGISAFCYSLLIFHHVNLPVAQFNHEAIMSLHIVGMWVTFLLSASVIVYFMAGIRERDELLSRAREQTLQDERILALGTLAAGAAHELGTPLATMTILAKELEHEYADNHLLVKDLSTLRRQVEVCKTTISRLLASAGRDRLEGCRAISITEFTEEVIERWRLMRPIQHFEFTIAGNGLGPHVAIDETLSQALINLLNNAADVSPDGVGMRIDWDQLRAIIHIVDRGDGLQGEAMIRAGEAFFTTKQPGEGTGLGLFLAKASIERLGGTLHMSNREGGGLLTRVTLPNIKDIQENDARKRNAKS
ncbi:MAG: ATP-binding protein [Pseudomonadota bacterium]